MTHWINEDVKINFKVCNAMQKILDKAEKLDAEGDWLYLNVADAIDHFTKCLVIEDLMTVGQREILYARYCDVYDKF